MDKKQSLASGECLLYIMEIVLILTKERELNIYIIYKQINR